MRVASDAGFVEFMNPFAADLGTYDFRELTLTGRAALLSPEPRETVCTRLVVVRACPIPSSSDSGGVWSRVRLGTGGTSSSESSAGFEEVQKPRDLRFWLLTDLMEPALLRRLTGREEVAGWEVWVIEMGIGGSGGSVSTVTRPDLLEDCRLRLNEGRRGGAESLLSVSFSLPRSARPIE